VAAGWAPNPEWRQARGTSVEAADDRSDGDAPKISIPRDTTCGIFDVIVYIAQTTPSVQLSAMKKE